MISQFQSISYTFPRLTCLGPMRSHFLEMIRPWGLLSPFLHCIFHIFLLLVSVSKPFYINLKLLFLWKFFLDWSVIVSYLPIILRSGTFPIYGVIQLPLFLCCIYILILINSPRSLRLFPGISYSCHMKLSSFLLTILTILPYAIYSFFSDLLSSISDSLFPGPILGIPLYSEYIMCYV